MGMSNRYQLWLEEEARKRNACQPRHRDDEAGFVGQAFYGAVETTLAVDPDADTDEQSQAQATEDAEKVAAFGDLFDAILAGTAPDAILERATKCATDCARMTGRPVAQFLSDSARTVAISEIYGD